MGNIVAIVDSGINFNDAYIMGYVMGGICIQYDDNIKKVIYVDEFNDDNGHGTFCCYSALSVNKNTRFFIIKILDRDCRCNSILVKEALIYLKTINVNVISLSFSTTKNLFLEEIDEAINQLVNQNKIVVAAMNNNGLLSFPAELESVICVDKPKIYKKYDDIEHSNQIIFQIDSEDLVIKYNGIYKLFTGTSKETPKVARMLIEERYYNNENVFENIRKNMSSITKEIYTLTNNKLDVGIITTNIYSNIIEDIKQVLYKILKCELAIDEKIEYSNKEQINDLIRELEGLGYLNCDFKCYKWNAFKTIKSLATLIMEIKYD